MKQALLALLILAQIPHAGAQAGDESSPPGVENQSAIAPRTWLGLKVEKLDESVAAQVAELPPGFGFLVKSLDKDGPAQKAGLKELDILWKFRDQMLANESQLVALLRLAKPGEEIPLAIFRAGKPLEIKVALGESPVPEPPATADSGNAVDTTPVGVPTRVVNVADRTASFSAEDGNAVVWNDNGVFHVRITGLKDEVLHEGAVSREGKGEGIPQAWQEKVEVLCRTLEQSLSGNLIPQRQPRPRVVVPASYQP
ncbi:MAG: PDZ domain-containing protein [Verrucomicrobiaceae bacterium]|nr:MAG: PDZ domain-containing protein [Verrucomicrobiaceae bacterium]